ncbi:MAG: hypothetical protein IIZ73_09295 [Ruminococcus sp.]|nr:hypothetical protein [Ruminococcus sp.]
MAIERVIFDQSSIAANNAEILDFIGTLPSGLTVSSTNQFKVTGIGPSGNDLVVADANTSYSLGFRTSHGVLITQSYSSSSSSSSPFIVLTTTNLGTDAVIATTGNTRSIHMIDLEYSINDYSMESGTQKNALITSFMPIVLGTRSYTPHCFFCLNAQDWGFVACQMIVGGRSFAYSGKVALED